MEQLEIERKYLVLNDSYKREATKQYRLIQGYLNTDPERTVRVRIKEDTAFVTVKGKGNASGTTRFEWETPIPVHEAKQLLALSEGVVIDKIRYEVPFENHLFEVDEFFGKHVGLIIAEIELQHEEEHFLKPDWLGDEVTGQKQYYNSYLSKNTLP